jgi:hypothetical protein
VEEKETKIVIVVQDVQIIQRNQVENPRAEAHNEDEKVLEPDQQVLMMMRIHLVEEKVEEVEDEVTVAAQAVGVGVAAPVPSIEQIKKKRFPNSAIQKLIH